MTAPDVAVVSEKSIQDKWPAVEAAYTFVPLSYQLLSARYEAADTRLTAILTLASTLTLGAPIFARTIRPDISFGSPLLWVAISVYALGAVAGVVGRVRGSIVLPDPTVIFETTLHQSEWSFKMNQIFWAGQNFRKNAEAIRQKGNVAIWLTVALLVEVLLLVGWIGLSEATHA